MVSRALVIGAGIGGLLSAAALLRDHEVTIFEKLPFAGGRFTNIEHKGFKLSTGALHMIPHGDRGPFANLLKELGSGVKIIRSDPFATVRLDSGKEIMFEEFEKVLSLNKRLKLAYLAVKTKFNMPECSFKDWFYGTVQDEWLVRFANAFCGWTLSLTSEEVPAREVIEVIENIRRYGGPGVPSGGCGAVTRSLVELIESNGGKIHLKQKVEKIRTQNSEAKGVTVADDFIPADLIISNIGHTATAKLLDKCPCSEYPDKISHLTPSAGIKICFSSEEPLIGHSGVLFTPGAKRVNGINEVTNADPSLAPEGKHLVMSHQALDLRGVRDIKAHITREIELGIKDLREIFRGKKFEILLVQSYHDGWPVNRAASGQDAGTTTPFSNLSVVGDGAKGKGGIEVEGIAMGVNEVINHIRGV